MASSPLDEDGFHSIAWDDAPPRPLFSGSNDALPEEDDGEGFETISPVSPPPDSPSTLTANNDTPRAPRRDVFAGNSGVGTSTMRPEDWEGRWMSIEVFNPMKEHEGSKEMFVSYAVRTKVRSFPRR